MFFVLLALNAKPGGSASESLYSEIASTGRVLLRNLSLLFVPAGVGVVRNLNALRTDGFALALAVFVSTTLTLVCAVIAFRLAARLMGEEK